MAVWNGGTVTNGAVRGDSCPSSWPGGFIAARGTLTAVGQIGLDEGSCGTGLLWCAAASADAITAHVVDRPILGDKIAGRCPGRECPCIRISIIQDSPLGLFGLTGRLWSGRHYSARTRRGRHFEATFPRKVLHMESDRKRPQRRHPGRTESPANLLCHSRRKRPNCINKRAACGPAKRHVMPRISSLHRNLGRSDVLAAV